MLTIVIACKWALAKYIILNYTNYIFSLDVGGEWALARYRMLNYVDYIFLVVVEGKWAPAVRN